MTAMTHQDQERVDETNPGHNSEETSPGLKESTPVNRKLHMKRMNVLRSTASTKLQSSFTCEGECELVCSPVSLQHQRRTEYNR
eukprot:CAMPEP_0196744260 /NCGR_PEP_ID=MMETSP1091-20130531/56616_1 /TAXON_ID=302021 /ORGANISM="Rhodomonas sp., Strain CCMP768" /LENGTH=83 /DNA_ID=CAMNT_0042090765 /DNA_START=87 /DNA_END=335 /DNA_ORIENTATION=-